MRVCKSMYVKTWFAREERSTEAFMTGRASSERARFSQNRVRGGSGNELYCSEAESLPGLHMTPLIGGRQGGHDWNVAFPLASTHLCTPCTRR